MCNVRIATFQWLTGGFAGMLGALMLVSPHQFANPVYAPFQPYLSLVGTGLLVTGLGLPATLVFAGQRRWLVFCVHIVLAAAFASLGVLVISGGAWSGAPSSTFAAVGLLFAAGISLGHSSGQRGPDLLGIVVAATATSLGCMLLLAPGQFGSPVYSLLLPHATLVGAALLAGGIATAAAQFGLHHIRPFVWAAHLLLASAYFAVLGLVAIPFAAWTAIPYYGGFGAAIALLPALGPYVERLDAHSLTVRLSVSFALASTLPLVIAMGAVTSQRQFIGDGAPNSSQTANLSSRVRENVSQDQAFEVLLSCIALATVAGALGAKALSAPLRRIAFAIEKLPDATQSPAMPASGLTEMSQILMVFEATRTQLSSSQQALIHANRELVKASQMKSDFLANMSHELRTPLNAIIGFAEVLLDPELNEMPEQQHAEFLGNIHRSGRHLLGLINDILDLSKVEAGRMELHRESVPLDELIQGCVAIVQPLAYKKRITVTATCQPAGTSVNVDPARLKQILYNLLSNAVKFTPDNGQVSVTVEVNEQEARVAVRDNGIGIKGEDQALVFEEFRQVDQAATRQEEGTGLGLALVRKLVELHGGKIWVDSAPGQGSCFTFSLPILAGTGEKFLTGPSAPAPRAAVGRRGAKGLPILVVEDERQAAEILTLHLTRAGYDVHRASTGDQALAVARELQPFAITLDVLLPGRDGWDILTVLKSDPATRDIPVVMVSVDDNRELGFALGAADYMVKPIKKDALLATLKRLGSSGSSGDRRLTVLVVDDDPAARQLMSKVLAGANCDLILAEDGSQALHTARSQKLDLMLLDLMMPGMSGFDVVRELRRSPETSGLPVVICTAKELTPEERDELSTNVEGVLEKGSATNDILLELLQLERLYPSLAGIVGGPTGYAVSGHFLPHLDRELSRAKRHDRSFSVLSAKVQAANRDVLPPDLLGQLCEFLSRHLRRHDVVAYQRDDEIVVLLPEIGPEHTRTVLSKLKAAVDSFGPSDLDGPVELRIAIGQASYPAHAHTAEELIDHARSRRMTSSEEQSEDGSR